MFQLPECARRMGASEGGRETIAICLYLSKSDRCRRHGSPIKLLHVCKPLAAAPSRCCMSAVSCKYRHCNPLESDSTGK